MAGWNKIQVERIVSEKPRPSEQMGKHRFPDVYPVSLGCTLEGHLIQTCRPSAFYSAEMIRSLKI